MRNLHKNPFINEFNNAPRNDERRAIGLNGRITSSATRGNRNISAKQERLIRSQTLTAMAKKTGIFELIWYPMFIIGGLICLLFIRPINLELILCVVQLWLCMTANNLAARGNRYGLILNTISMSMYVYVCISNAIWGEVIINLAWYIPLEIIGFFKWKQASEGNSSNVLTINKFTPIGYVYCTLAVSGLALAIALVLHYFLAQSVAIAICNAVMISTGIIGAWMRNRRYIEVWFIWVLCNLAGISLWLVEIFTGTAGEISLSVLPLVLSYTSTLTNDFNGWALWAVMFKKQNSADRVYLAHRKVNVKRIAKLKSNYRKFTCRETEDIATKKFQTR